MSRLPISIAGLLAAGAVIVAYRTSPMLGLALFIAAVLGFAGYLLRDDVVGSLDVCLDYLGRPMGRTGRLLLGAWIVTAPAVLFFDPASFAPGRHGHIDRPPTDFYQLISDDVAYVAASRTWDRTVANLLVPHNTHIVPSWRLATWALVAAAGSLHGLPPVLAMASYSILVAVMLMTGRLAARETGRGGVGLAASAMVGTTSLMLTPAMWYSGGQPLWAGFAILSALWYAQSFRRGGRWPNLVLMAVAASVAGGFWSAGHLAGPVTAVYLWFDGRRRCRLAAAVPLAATAATVALTFAFAAKPMDSTVSFHGRTIRQAANPVQGAITTAQSIPENLVFANLGLAAETTPVQGVALTLALLALWASRRWRRTPGLLDEMSRPSPKGAIGAIRWPWFAANPMECAGAAMVLGCYLLEWTFRGYFEYQNLRTISPYVIVPWYDLIPQVGAVLFAVGWWSGPHETAGLDSRPVDRRPATRSTALVIAIAILVLIALNRPRVDALIRKTSPDPGPAEQEFFKVPHLLTMRASTILSMRVDWQRRYLRRLDQAEAIARRLGIGQEDIRAAFGFVYIPGSTGRLLQTQRELYDVPALLDLPPHGRVSDPDRVRAALGPYLRMEDEPRPSWIPRGEPWPPRSNPGAGEDTITHAAATPGARGRGRLAPPRAAPADSPTTND